MERRILGVLADMQAAGAVPSFEEVGFYVGVKSRGAICTRVQALARKGLVAKLPQASTIRLTALGASMVAPPPPPPPFRGGPSVGGVAA